MYYSDAQTPVTTSRSSLLCPSIHPSIHRNANGASSIRRERRVSVSPRQVFRIPTGIPKMRGISDNQVSIPILCFLYSPGILLLSSEKAITAERKRERGSESERYSSGFYGRFGAKAIFHACETRKLAKGIIHGRKHPSRGERLVSKVFSSEIRLSTAEYIWSILHGIEGLIFNKKPSKLLN